MSLEFYQDLLATAFFSLLMAFLLSKLTAGEQPSDQPLASSDLLESPENIVDDSLIAEEEVIACRKDDDDEEEEEGEGAEMSCEMKEGSLLDDEDEWEGIEKSGVEKLFALAAEYSIGSSGAEAMARLSRDVRMELYGFHKVATEGPCNALQPLRIKFSGWARWHAWQKLGSMTPEIAMEQYISLLSKSIPGWIFECSGDGAKLSRADDPLGKVRWNTGHHDFDSSFQNQPCTAIERKSEDNHDLASLEADSATGNLKILEQGLAGSFFLDLLFPARGALFSL